MRDGSKEQRLVEKGRVNLRERRRRLGRAESPGNKIIMEKALLGIQASWTREEVVEEPLVQEEADGGQAGR